MASSPQGKLAQWWTRTDCKANDNVDAQKHLSVWECARFNSDRQYYVESFKIYKPQTKTIKKQVDHVKCKEFTEYRENKSLNDNDSIYAENSHVIKLCEDFKMLFDNGKRTDLTIFVKDERQIKCHTLILLARCNAILDDIIEQKSSNTSQGNKMICWDSFEYEVADSFLKYLYNGQLPSKIRRRNMWEQHKTISMKYGMLDYLRYLNSYDKSKFDVNDEDCANFTQSDGGFFCDDESLNHPDVKEAISNGECFAIWASVFLVIVLPVEISFHNVYGTQETNNRICSIPWIFIELYRILGFFSLGALCTIVTTEVAKFKVGR